MLKLKLDRILAVALGILWLGVALEDSPPLRADQAPPPYDPQSVKTVEGTVEKVESYAPAGGTDFARVILKAKGGTLALLLGPIEYLAKNQLTLAEGDRVVVTGSDVGEGRTPGEQGQDEEGAQEGEGIGERMYPESLARD